MQYSSTSLDSSFNSPPQASPLNDRKRKKLISELQNGRRAATELHHHFLAARDHHVSTMEELQVSAAELLTRIISSFICCLTFFPDMAGGCDHQEIEQEGKAERGISKNEKKQRGGSKKRKITEKTMVVESTDLTDDGHAWRKYGHKRIKSSPYPRDYYKCTHWQDQHCQAKKWVQKVSDQPSIYRTTYDKEHTCRSASRLTISTPHGFSSLVSQSADSCTYLSFGGESNHQSTTRGAVVMDHQENHVLQSNSLFFGTPPSSSSSSSSSSLLKILQDIEDLNNNGSLQQTTVGSTENDEMETAKTTSEEDIIDLMQIVEKPTNPYDGLSEIRSSSHHIISDVAPINMGHQDQYYDGDAVSSVEEAFLFPATSNCNYMTIQEDTMGHDHAFDSIVDMYFGDVF